MTALYLAGPMRGLPDLNFPAFHDAAYSLRYNGFDVFNPAETGLENIRECLAADLKFIAEEADGVATLPGAAGSLGTRAEVALAAAIGIPVRPVMSWIRPQPIIGLSGYARAGKDTVGQLLGSCDYVTCSFAAALKEAAYTLNPKVYAELRLADVVEVHGWDDAKTTFREVRPFLQRLGTDVARNLLGENVWVDIAFRDMPLDGPVAFTDVRFPNEAAAIVARGGQVWRIERPGHEPANAHASEIALDDWPFDRVIVNDGTIADLRDKVYAALKPVEVPA